MLLAICHISDIHISTDRDPVLGRAKAIVAAVGPRISPGTAMLLVCSGDVAYSGGRDQYRAADPFFAELETGLRQMPSTRLLGAVFVPGNHDCDFSAAGDARPILVAGIAQNITKADLVGESLQDLLKVQSNFFEFAARVGKPAVPVLRPGVGWTLPYEEGGRRILVRCLNTAVLSQLRESPGELQFPLHGIPELKGDADFALTVFHHPYPWLAPDNRRELQRRVESSQSPTLCSPAMSTMAALM
jgi:Calcineurin-like phosphoesterase